MAERDLLNKFLGTLTPDVQASKVTGRPAAAPVNKLGVAQPAREVGREEASVAPRSGAAAPANEQAEQAPAPPAAAPPRAKAFKAAYFNRDVQATREVNLSAAPLKALRGEEGASDLRRVVLPLPDKAQAPSEPAVLVSALERMVGQSGQGAPNLAELLERQTQWSHLPTVKPELIEARRRLLEAMVAARKAALARMRKLLRRGGQSDTIDCALAAEEGGAAGNVEGLEAQGDGLIGKTAQRAAPMAKRLAKVVRSKL